MRSTRFLLITTLSLVSLGSIALYAYTQSEPAKKAPLLNIPKLPIPLDAPRPLPAPVKPWIPQESKLGIPLPPRSESVVKIQGKATMTTTVIKLKHAPAQQMSDVLMELYNNEFEMHLVVAAWNNAIVVQASAQNTATIRAMIDDLDTTFEGEQNPSETEQ